MRDYSDFGRRVKIAMISLNLTNRELARQLGYTESTLCDVLRGRNQNPERMREIQALVLKLKEEQRKTELS